MQSQISITTVSKKLATNDGSRYNSHHVSYHKDEFITQKLGLKHTQMFRPCHMVFYNGGGLSDDRRVT